MIALIQANFPTTLNPCTKIKHYRTALWNVKGYLTTLCSDCVFEKEKECGSRKKALATFTPDLSGVKCK
jgi:hypothetical protein